MTQRYLPGLNGIRAIAAMAVLLSHIALNLEQFGLSNLPATDLAGFGVTLFFALSGFLITFLLLQEKDGPGIDIRKFYIRRILRIWPLYFLYMGLSFLLVGFATGPALVYYLLFLSNVPFVLGAPIGILAHYWSLGVEEQFYLFWPVFIRNSKRVFVVLILFVSSFLLLKFTLRLLYGGWSVPYTFVYTTRFDCMGIGGIGAWLFLNKRMPGVVYSRWLQVVCWGILALTLFNQFHTFSIIDHEIMAVVTVVLIVNQISNPNVMFSLERRPLSYVGKISFGIYVYHPLVIALTAPVIRGMSGSPLQKAALVYLIVVVLTLGIAHVSYFFFESIFLKFKERFAAG